MTVLLATASVHTTAAACDHLQGTDEDVLVLTVEEPGTATRDAGDAANVARTRLPNADVETLTREGEPAGAILDVADERDVSRVVLGQRAGDPARAGDPPGSTVRAVLAAADRPVVVVPV